MDQNLDARHATPEVAALVTSVFADKSTRGVDLTMAHFSEALMTYTDTTIGDTYRDWAAQKAVFEKFMARWA